MKQIYLLLFLLLAGDCGLEAQKVNAGDVAKLKHRNNIIVVQSQPEAKSFKKLSKKHPEDAEQFQNALDELNKTLPEAIARYFYGMDSPKVDIKTAEELKDIKKDRNRTKTVIAECVSNEVQVGNNAPIGSAARTHAFNYTAPLEWNEKEKMFTSPVIQFYFAENYPNRAFYQLLLPKELPDYADIALSLLYARFIFDERYKNKSMKQIRQDARAHFADLKDKTLLLCKEWLSSKFDEAKAREDYGYPLKIIPKAELISMLRSSPDSLGNYAAVTIVTDILPNGSRAAEVNVPFILNLSDGMPLSYSNTVTGDALKGSLISLATAGFVQRTGFGNLSITNKDMENFVKHIGK